MQFVIKFQTSGAGKLRNQRQRKAQHKAELGSVAAAQPLWKCTKTETERYPLTSFPVYFQDMIFGMFPILYKETQVERYSNSKFSSLDHILKLNCTI